MFAGSLVYTNGSFISIGVDATLIIHVDRLEKKGMRERFYNFNRGILYFLVCLTYPIPTLYAEPADDTITALIAERIIDGVSEKALDSNVLLVQHNKILALGSRSIIPEDARVIDLGQTTLMPGLIDSHLHPLLHTDDYQFTHIKTSSAYKALKGHQTLLKLLKAGWTSVRIAGDSDIYYANQDIKRLIDEKVLQGPRIAGAAHYLSVTGGGGDINFVSPEQNLKADGLIVDGVDEIRKAIRNEAKYGSDWIKVLITGAFMSVGDNPKSVHFSDKELEALFAEAARRDMPVMAHAHATEGIKKAVRAGARSIEHGTYLDDEAIRLMKKHGTFLVPTIYVGDYYSDPKNNLREQDANDDYILNYRSIFLQKIGAAHRAGVKIVVGSDLGGYQYPANVYAREFATLVEAGLSTMQAIKAGTSVAAEMLRWDDRLGTLEVGKLADVIAVEGNPLEDISVLEHVSFVMSDGVVVKH